MIEKDLKVSSSNLKRLPASQGQLLDVDNNWIIPIDVTEVNVPCKNIEAGSWLNLRRATTKGTRPTVKFVDGIYVHAGQGYGGIFPNPAQFTMTEATDIDLFFDGKVWTKYPYSAENDDVVINEVYLYTTGNFTVPDGVTSLKVRGAGGGGGGGGAANDNSKAHGRDMANGAGGSGGASIEVTIPVTSGEVIQFSVGAGGVFGLTKTTPANGHTNVVADDGGNGGTTLFGPTQAGHTITLNGGGGGGGGKIEAGRTIGGVASFAGAGEANIGNVVNGALGGVGWDYYSGTVGEMSGKNVVNGGFGFVPQQANYGFAAGYGATLHNESSSKNGAGGNGAHCNDEAKNGANGFLHLSWGNY